MADFRRFLKQADPGRARRVDRDPPSISGSSALLPLTLGGVLAVT